ncbi:MULTISPECIES: hypothetical protein [Kamptonema]|uniref:hypothetical protein n=1 Tax=Kamptonema TaxID=1501433 RepID=UPI0012D748F3|nr:MULTISPECIES: hypothetical protein [Kamptonema]
MGLFFISHPPAFYNFFSKPYICVPIALKRRDRTTKMCDRNYLDKSLIPYF